MRSARITQVALMASILGALATTQPGCGSGKATDGSHLDLSVPKEQAKAQDNAYQDYMKKAQKRPGR